jgi:hypothetical protein
LVQAGQVCQDLSNNALFTNVFKITRPQLDLISFQEIVAHCNKHIVIQLSGITLRGQFELVGENILFVVRRGLRQW